MPLPDEAALELGHILFMDIVGYSKLLVDEQTSCAERLNKIVLASAEFQAAKSADQLIRLPTGDGMVLVFFSNPEAPVRCAIQIAEAINQGDALPLRMGVHSGPINRITDVNQRSNAIGGGINLAQRIMDCGDSGHILLSNRVAEDLSQYRRWQPLLHELGEIEVKHGVKVVVVNLHSDRIGNAQRPLRFLHAVADRDSQRFDSLAVKPLENISGDAHKGYFADGMTDELITKLSQISALKRVISRSTMMKYKDTEKSTGEIARELQVKVVLEGSVLLMGEQVRISAQLIDAKTDRALWANSFIHPLSNILVLQNEVALSIARAIELALTPAEEKRLNIRGTVNPRAYDYYLRGKGVYGRSAEETRERIDFLEKSIYLDDTFADAHAELSIGYSSRAYFLEGGAKEWEIKAEAEAEKALSLDPRLPAALLARARLAWRPAGGFQHRRSIELVHQALAVAPNSSDAHIFLGSIYFHVGLLEDALEHFRRADALNPGDPTARFNIGQMTFLLGRYEEAITVMQENVTGMVRAFVEYNIATALFCSERGKEARERISRAKAEFEDEGGILTAMEALFLALDGERDRAEAKIQESIRLGEGFGHFHHTTLVFAAAYAAMGEPQPAMKWLWYTVENGYPNLSWLDRDPTLDPLRQNPEFVDLLKKMRLRHEAYQALAHSCEVKQEMANGA